MKRVNKNSKIGITTFSWVDHINIVKATILPTLFFFWGGGLFSMLPLNLSVKEIQTWQKY